MQYYPIRPVEGGGGGHLIGAAALFRTADLYAPEKSYTSLFRNCEYESVVGDAGSIDSATGEITIPSGTEFIRICIHQAISGSISYFNLRVAFPGEADFGPNSDAARPLVRGSGDFISTPMSRSTNGAESFKVTFYPAAENFTIDGTNWNGRNVGTVEFFG